MHFGCRVTLAALNILATQDVRAFMAYRRGHGSSGRSLMRSLAGARSFARFLERQGTGKGRAPGGLPGPKAARTLPKALAVAPAKRLTDVGLRAGEERQPWVLARDAAVLALLYGSGLRISEALSPSVKELPRRGRGDTITVPGRGNMTRMVPVLLPVLQLVADYFAICPYERAPDAPAFVGAKGGPLSPRIIQLVMEGLRAAFTMEETGTPHALR